MGIDGVKGIGDMKIAEIRNLSYSYRENCGQKKAVSNVSFDFDEVECLGLIGIYRWYFRIPGSLSRLICV